MATRGQLRRRQTQQSARSRQKPPSTSAHSASTTPTSSAGPRWLSHPVAQTLFLILRACVLGVLFAASLSRDIGAILLFVVSAVSMLLALLATFISILRHPDNTPVQLAPVHRPDGSVLTPDPITVHDHDKKIATYFASEFPALAMAAAWMYAWTNFRPAVLCYTTYLCYRLAYHPLFRIHLWKEPYCDDFQRPFDGVPLFKEGNNEPVQVVNGNDAFDNALNEAREGQLVVVDFSAKWCGPCKAIAPFFVELATEMTDVRFLTVDVDVSQDIAAKMAISSIPTFILFRNGERLELLRGASPDKLRDTIQQHM